MKLFVTSAVLGLVSVVTAVDVWAGINPTDAAPSGCPKPTPWYNCVSSQAAVSCPPTNYQCQCSSAKVQLGCFHSYCPNAPIGPIPTGNCDSVPTTNPPVGAAATAVPTAEEFTGSQASVTASPKFTGESNSAPSTSGATDGATGAGSSQSASASVKPNAGDRSMSISGGLWAVAAAAFGAIVYRL